MDGDGWAFATFYARHKGAVFSHCMMRLRNRADAEDVTAEVFAIAWRRRADVYFHPEADILPWLLVAANNVTRHHLRAVSRRERLLRRAYQRDRVPDVAEGVVEHDAASRARVAALTVLESLPAKDRDIIELVHYHGLSPAVVAAASGVPAGTVRARLSRALARARERYDALIALSEDGSTRGDR